MVREITLSITTYSDYETNSCLCKCVTVVTTKRLDGLNVIWRKAEIFSAKFRSSPLVRQIASDAGFPNRKFDG